MVRNLFRVRYFFKTNYLLIKPIICFLAGDIGVSNYLMFAALRRYLRKQVLGFLLFQSLHALHVL